MAMNETGIVCVNDNDTFVLCCYVLSNLNFKLLKLL